jgi:hypothetical protein
MATTAQVRTAGRGLRDSLQAKVRDGTFDPDDRDDFGRIHLGLTQRLSAFATAPSDGPSSPRYDSFVAKAQEAKSAVDSCTASSSSSIQRAKTLSQAASNKLPPITGPAA